MKIGAKVFVMGWALVGITAARAYGQQKPDANNASLGDIARELKAQKAKAPKPVRVFTNDDIPASRDGGFNSGAGAAAKPSATAPSQASESPADVHDEKYYRTRKSELENNLNTHNRELDVLQQKLGQNEMQYYPNPNKTLQQEYTRGDVNKLTKDIEDKKQQIADDERAIDDLRDQLRRDNGDPSWLEGTSTSAEAASPATSPSAAPENKSESSSNKAQTRDYWQERFKAARRALSKAKELEQLAEDELNLLQIQQARELEATAKADLTAKVQAKQDEVNANKTSTENARKALIELEKEFRESGAPEDWSRTD
jgi:hypothetical protein